MNPLSSKIAPCMTALIVGGGITLMPDIALASDVVNAFSVGLTLSFSMGARPAFGIGPDFRYTLYYRPSYDPLNPASYSSDYFGGGFFFQPTYLRGGAWRISGGIQGSRLIDKFFLPNIELGISHRSEIAGGEPGGFGMHVGLLPMFTFLDYLPVEHGPSFRAIIGLSSTVKNEFIIGHDIRSPGACFFVRCITAIAGRPLRVEPNTSPVRASLIHRAPRQTPSRLARGLDFSQRHQIAAHFARDASTEGASIPAFLALARDLQRSGAPTSLVAHARRAAQEESVHTQLCCDLAGEFGGAELDARIPSVPQRNDTDKLSLLKRLAIESFWDGCVGEGAAAAQARRQCAATNLTKVSETLAIIARDEQGHADLSERIVAFCIDQGGADVRNALYESVEQKRNVEETELESGTFVETDNWCTGFGVPDATMIRLAREEALETSLKMVV